MENENLDIMITTKRSDLRGNSYTMVDVMDFRRERIWHVNFENMDNEPIPEGVREFVRQHSEKIKEGRWHYNNVIKK